MRSFFYTMCIGGQQEHVAVHHQLLEICKRFHILPEHIVIEQVDVKQAVSKQRLLRQLINHEMNRQDTLVIPDLSCLGRTVEDLEEILFFCLQKDIFIYSYHPASRIEPSAESCVSFLIARQDTIDIHNLKSTKSRYRHIKKKLGRKEGSNYRSDIAKLKSGRFTQAETAKKLGISLSTVKRHWNNGIIG
ncbi:hypothetical protein SMKC004_36370 [Serratia marcescens]|nr:hypothetical protein SMKC004_36370 [Serratia marcescens]